MTRILGIDPGKANGYAVVYFEKSDSEAVKSKLWLEQIGTLSELQLYDLLGKIGHLDEVIVETFRNRPKKARTGAFDWSDNHTSQVIGAIKLWSIQTKTLLVEQEPAQKVPGYGFLKKKYVQGRPDVHHFDALAHVVFRLVTHYKIPPELIQWSKSPSTQN